MAMQPRLGMRAEQRLVMTPMLQQSIALLPLNRLEMQEAVQQELLENPLLEETQEDVGEVADGDMPELRDDLPESENDERGEVEIDWENMVQGGYEDFTPLPGDEDDSPTGEQSAPPATLHEHLALQLHLSVVPEPLARVAEQIIWNVDEQGYLRADAEQLAVGVGLGPEEAEAALAIVQGFTPPGVGARTLQECLLIQLENLAASENGEGRLLDLARVLVRGDIEKIGEGQYARLARANGVRVEDVVRAVHLVRGLDPYPGLRFSEERVEVIIPDVSVVKRDGDYEVTLNDDGLPPLRVSARYAAMAGDKAGTPPEARKYLDERLRAAVWFVKSIEQRRRTILGVARSIVGFQRDFLDHGVSRLKPLVLRDVAQDIDMHESTVSRVTTGKYMDTPQGVLGFKYFFPSRLSSRVGGDTSSAAVKQIIKKAVEAEDPARPLTDQRIAEKLEGEDVMIARRTVAKYRKELGIPSTSRRRRQR